MAGVKGRSGRKPKRCTEITRWVENEMQKGGKIVALMEKLYDMGINGDREAAIYVCNRVLGTPKQSLETKTTNIVLTGDELARQAQMMEALRLEEQKLLSLTGETIPSTNSH